MQRRIHLINPFWNAAGGSEWRTLELFDLLRGSADVHLWASAKPDPRLAARAEIRRIQPEHGEFPRMGTFVFVGDYRPPRDWIEQAQPRRSILVYNTHSPRRLAVALQRLSLQGRRPVEIVFASRLLQDLTGIAGQVQASWIDLRRFLPVQAVERPFTVGRLSRDVVEKHHSEDPALYRRLQADGTRMRLMGATCLAGILPPGEGIELLPANAEPAERFLASLDCFYYRTSPQWTEAWGRVVLEAMACGLPVVCERRGGYTEAIEDGVDGLLFDDTDEAETLLRRLRDDAGLRQRLGAAARAKAESLFSTAERQRTIDWYLR
ncbi:glycosyltransferase family 4 protein [Arenimonas sp.]|uniref:glycosyltransferase family 4 protein n=1 Tax=Arenimonas sp. TaxID=1872635 RepID=UPI0039E4608C